MPPPGKLPPIVDCWLMDFVVPACPSRPGVALLRRGGRPAMAAVVARNLDTPIAAVARGPAARAGTVRSLFRPFCEALNGAPLLRHCNWQCHMVHGA